MIEDLQRITATCDICGKIECIVSQRTPVDGLFGGEHVRSNGVPPEDWTKITLSGYGSKIICPKHTVKVTVDNQLAMVAEEEAREWRSWS